MRLGVGGIRTVEHVQPDGSVMRLSHRGGHPLYEIVEGGAGSRQAAENYRRGFVAVLPGATTGTLFNPYNLAVVQHGFKPAGALYYVLDFATNWNVSPSDTTNWRDVIVFSGNKILINGLRMAPPLQDLASVPAGSVPYFINTGLPGSQYGRTQDRRTFAVARELVKSWASTGITETLTPATPRTDEKALTIGPSIVRGAHKAWLGQLYYTGPTATDDAGVWAFSQREVNMMLASPFLSGTNSSASVDMAPPALVSAGTDTTARGTPITLPSTPIALKSNDARIVQSNQNLRIIYWYWDSTFSSPLQAQEYGNNTRLTYSGSGSASVTQAGVTLDFTCSNVKTWDTRSIGLVMDNQHIPIAASGQYANYLALLLNANATNLIWSDTYAPLRGVQNVWVASYWISPPGTNPTRYYENQTISATVEAAGAILLISVSASSNTSSGGAWNVTPNATHYNARMGQPSTYPGQSFEMGIYGRLELNARWYPASDTIPVNDYYKQNIHPPPKQTPAVLAEIDASFDSKAAEYQTQTYYDCENSNGVSRFNFYTAAVNPSVSRSSKSLTWQTRDFILFDEDNGVYIIVVGNFSGQDSNATLTVSLVIETRHDTTTVQLLTRDYTYADLLPEYEIGSTGKYAVPSPQVRAMFAPLHREQGSFKGAHYVTLDEENAGAAPAHLFSLQLILHSFSDMGQVNALNATSAGVHFVPFNLLEMLYCFVFSQDYGVGASTLQRYPVTFPARYNDLMMNLFGVPFNITVRDGVETPWTHSLHSSFVGVHGASLHRV
jgi:hypothetical protein